MKIMENYSLKSLNTFGLKVDAKYFICIGDNEIESKSYVIKDLETKEEKSVELRD